MNTNAEDRPRIPPGTRLNGIYEIERLIAVGGMGEVYAGMAVESGIPVAIKMIRPELAADPMISDLFRREASALHRMRHESIVGYYVFSVDPALNATYMAMEYVPGRSLSDVVAERPLDLRSVKRLQKRLASGLHVAHELGIIHRDISADNIILPESNTALAKIIDFGIARNNVETETIIGSQFAGKNTYSSPEQFGLFGGHITPKSDVYSLGLVLAETMLGHPIDMRGTMAEVVSKRETVPDLSEIDSRMVPLLEWMLQPNPADRPTMEEVAAWEVPGDTLPPTAYPRKSGTYHPRSAEPEPKSPVLLIAAAGGGGLLLALGLAAFFFWPSSQGIGPVVINDPKIVTPDPRVVETPPVPPVIRTPPVIPEVVKTPPVTPVPPTPEIIKVEPLVVPPVTPVPDTVTPPNPQVGLQPTPVIVEPVVPTPVIPVTPVVPKKATPDCKACTDLVLVPEGRLTMGSNRDATEKPAHDVSIRSFLIGRFPVTVGDWRECVRAGGCAYEPKGDDKLPMFNVSFDEVQQYIAWASKLTGQTYRLPTEAEWEYAAHGDTKTAYWWGDTFDPSMANCRKCGPANNEPSPVGMYRPNSLGLYDLLGSIGQWVSDCWHKDYRGAPKDGSSWESASCKERVVRGGSWSSDPANLTVTSREFYDSSVRYPGHGFRIARNP